MHRVSPTNAKKETYYLITFHTFHLGVYMSKVSIPTRGMSWYTCCYSYTCISVYFIHILEHKLLHFRTAYMVSQVNDMYVQLFFLYLTFTKSAVYSSVDRYHIMYAAPILCPKTTVCPATYAVPNHVYTMPVCQGKNFNY